MNAAISWPRRSNSAAQGLRVGHADVNDLVDELASVACLVDRDARQRGPEGVHAVIAVLPRHDDALLRPSLDVPVAACQLAGGVHGVRPARPEEHDRIIHRCQGSESFRQPDGRLGRVGTERRVRREPGQLVGHGVGDLPPTVAHRAVPEGRGRVEITTTVGRLQPDALGRADDDLGILDHVHVGKAMPELGPHPTSLSSIGQARDGIALLARRPPGLVVQMPRHPTGAWKHR